MSHNLPSDDVATPTTPRRPAHDKINDIVNSLENNWRLGLTARTKTWSPSVSLEKTLATSAQNHIKYLFYKKPQALNELLDVFSVNAGSKPNTERLGYLNQLLEGAMPDTPRDPRGNSIGGTTSLPQAQDPESGRGHGPTNLQQRLQQAATPIAGKSKVSAAQSSVFNRPCRSRSRLMPQYDPSLNLQQLRRTPNLTLYLLESLPNRCSIATTKRDSFTSGIERASRGRTRAEPPAPLDSTPKAAGEDSHSTTPPQSPSLAVSLRKQSQLSSPAGDERLRRQSQHRRRGKRSSEESGDEPSPKHCRTSDEDTSDRERFPFTMPEPPMARVRAHQDSSVSAQGGRSAATSFTSTAGLSRSDSVFSQCRDNTTTANTSFATIPTNSQDGTVIDGEMFHSSGTVSLDTKEVLLQAISMFDPPSPQETVEDVPNNISPGKSMEHHQVKNLPYQGLFVPDLTGKLKSKPFKQRWEYTRVALANGVDPEGLMPHDETHEDYDALWNFFSRHPDCRHKLPRKGRADAWKDTEGENIKLKATLSINANNTGPLFKLNMEPLRVEESCRFQRKFGGDRFLYLEIPPLGNDISHLRNQQKYLQERIQQWLLEPKNFLGRTWKAFHLEDVKKKKSLRRPKAEVGARRAVLFATNGTDIPTKRVRDLIHWFMPLDLNSYQTFAKAFARISLGLTTTKPGPVFKPSQVRFVQDAVSDSTLEHDPYRDPSIRWPNGPINQQVMNDGCARISVGAAVMLWRSLKMSGPLPSAYQGRIGGAKGVWMLSAPTDTQDPDHRDIWIEVTDSQLKFKPHEEDLHDDSYDSYRLTFDLHSWTDTVSSSSLYISFIPILQDRGVPAKTLEALFLEYLDREKVILLDAVQDPVHLRRWINEQNDKSEQRSRETGKIPCLASMPISLSEQLVSFLESGFSPKKPFVAARIERLVARSLKTLRQSPRIPLAQCVYLKGVADPTGTLQPGEIHLYLSKIPKNDTSCEVFPFIDNRAVLVARNPALRSSDIQKVKATFKIGLTHLRDVVVFSSKGSFPLAGKLQGGDYDGDDFWVCWDPRLVEPFRNAPAPMDPPDPETYGIKVDKRKLGDVLQNSSSINPFLKESFQFRSQKAILGAATKLHEKVVYAENSIDSPHVNASADLHDLLVDAPKSGVVFDDEDLVRFQRKHLKNLPKKITLPAFKEAQEKDSLGKYNTKKSDSKTENRPNFDNIMDRLYFKTIKPHTEKTLEELCAQLYQEAEVYDEEALLEPYTRVRSNPDPEIRLEIETLEKSLKKVYSLWVDKFRGNKDEFFWNIEPEDDFPESSDAAIVECFQRYGSIMPTNRENPIISGWTENELNSVPAKWDLLKASTLWNMYKEKHSFLWNMAFRELSFLKADSTPGTRMIVQAVWANMKPRKIKKPIAQQQRMVEAQQQRVAEVKPEALSAPGIEEGDTEPDGEGFITAPEEDEEEATLGCAGDESVVDEDDGPKRQILEELHRIPATPREEPRRSKTSLGPIPKLTPHRMKDDGKKKKKKAPTLAT